MTSRRAFLTGVGAALATPSIVRAESLMKIVMPRAYGVGGITTRDFMRSSKFVSMIRHEDFVQFGSVLPMWISGDAHQGVFTVRTWNSINVPQEITRAETARNMETIRRVARQYGYEVYD